MGDSVNKYKSLAKDTGIFAIGSFGTKILSFLLMSLYTSFLTTSEYGIADVLTTTVSLLLPVLTLSAAEATLRFMFDQNTDKNDILNIDLAIVSMACIVVFAGSVLVCMLVPLLWDYYWYFTVIFSLTSFETSFSYIAKGSGHTKVFAIKGILYTFVFAVSNILLLTVFRLGITGYFLSFIIAYFITCSYLFFATRLYKTKLNFRINKSLFAEMMKYSIPFIPAAISWWINSSADKYMLIWMIDPGANGVYSAAQKIPTLLTAVTGIFIQAWQLSAMRNYQDDDFSEFFSHIFKLVSSLMLLCTCGILICNKLFASFLFQNEFFAAWRYVPMLSISAVFSALAGFLASAFTSAKKTNILFISTCCGAIVNIVLNYFLILYMGILGAAVATAISFLVMVVVRLLTMQKIVVLQVGMLKTSISFLLLFVAAILVAYIEHYYLITVSTTVIVVLLNIKEMKEVIRSVLHKLSAKQGAKT